MTTGAMTSRATGAGQFFAVDRRAWGAVCSLGLNEAIAYLALARGSGGDNRTTSWSVNAVENYTGISRPRAKSAIRRLISEQFIRLLQAGSRPRYYLALAHEILASKSSEPDPDWIWLPNSIIDGVSNETPPIGLLRQVQNISVLRLFVDLYGAHVLASDGGIHWRQIREQYTRYEVGQRGPFKVWGFERGGWEAFLAAPFVAPYLTGKTAMRPDGKGREDTGIRVFWGAWNSLIQVRLVEAVAHLIEADTEQAEIVHPNAIEGGQEAEHAIAVAAHQAGLALLTSGQQIGVADRGLCLVPVLAHMDKVQLVGIARLRYRPKTKATAAWWAKQSDWVEIARRYEGIAEGAAPAQSRRATSR